MESVLLSEKIPDKSDIIAMDLADIDFECAFNEAFVQRSVTTRIIVIRLFRMNL